MKVTIRFFPYLRDLVGAEFLERDVPANMSLGELIQVLQGEFPGLVPAIPHASITLNRAFVDFQARLAEGDEIALFPTISGG